jgi:serine/threonine-protein kinase
VTWLSNEVVAHLRTVATWPALPTDRYVILRAIGRGGMGTVYAATDRELGREVAVKISNAATAGSPFDARLRAEARILAALEHPGIVPIHDIGQLADGRVFCVMKLIRGDTLTAHAPRLAGDAARLGVFERIAETVAFAHAAGVVHRDLKPSNVMAGSFGEVLVLDWGVAEAVGVDASGVRVGTRGFMAPEQRDGGAPVGAAADVFALGAMLFWLLTGDVPPDAPASVPAALDRSRGRLPVRLRAIVIKCLSPTPADRYDGAGSLAADVARYRAGQPVVAHRDTWLERAGQWFSTYRTFILLVAAYLVMRAIVAWVQRG